MTMRSKIISAISSPRLCFCAWVMLVFAWACPLASAAPPPAYATLFSFCTSLDPFSCPDGAYPQAGVVFDAAGNLYGTTDNGGPAGNGTVFKLTPPRSGVGNWTETILYIFCTGGYPCPDGANPMAGLIFDSAGALYGTTGSGGTDANCGTVFKLTPAARSGGPWTEHVLYSFGSQSGDGCGPRADLIFDSSGALYGTTENGGANDAGTVFKLIPPTTTGGNWTETVLYTFCPAGSPCDGSRPLAGLIVDKPGNLYGTTIEGGSSGAGIVFKLIRPASANGVWTPQVLYNFCRLQNCADGENPQAGLTFDAAGNLYGTTSLGGNGGGGTIFKLMPPASSGGSWTESVLYNFCTQQNCADGGLPLAGLTSDGAGNLYGTTAFGGVTSAVCDANQYCGTVFKLARNGTFSVLHSFTRTGNDGAAPLAGVVVGPGNALYGTTANGGSANFGTVFKLRP
jgi:uncharacterized repeat protein (TIGR03803 family)